MITRMPDKNPRVRKTPKDFLVTVITAAVLIILLALLLSGVVASIKLLIGVLIG